MPKMNHQKSLNGSTEDMADLSMQRENILLNNSSMDVETQMVDTTLHYKQTESRDEAMNLSI